MKIGAFNVDGLLNGIRSRLPRLGVFFEERASRIVRIDHVRGGGLRIAGFGEVDAGILVAGEEDKQRFKMMVKHVGAGLTRVAASVEHTSLRIRRMNLAKMPERDLIEAIRWNFREYIEGEVDHYVVGFVPLEEAAEEGRMSCLAYGLPTEIVDEYVRTLKGLGLKPVALEPGVSAMLAAFHANGILEDGRYHVAVFVGDATSIFSVMRGHSLLFCRPLAGISEDTLAKLVMRNLSLPEDEARRALVAWVGGVQKDDELMRRLAVTVGHFFSQFVVEVQRSIDAFCIMYDIDRVDVLHICGRAAFYPGIVEHAHKTLGVEAAIFNPFAKLMEPERLTEEVARVAPLYAVAVGLAIP